MTITADSTRTYRRPDREGRPAHTSTTVLTSADPRWYDARQARNLAVDQRAAAVVVPGSARDADVVRFAREGGLRVAAQGTGHSAGPLSPLPDGAGAHRRAGDELIGRKCGGINKN